MKVYSVNTVKQPAFGRAFTSEEEELCRQTVKDAKKYLGLDNLALICHGTSYPNPKSYVGSINSHEAKEFENFINIFGFDSVQQGPNGRITRFDVSPYTSETFSRNILFIDFEKLNSQEYQKLIDDKTYSKMLSQKEKDVQKTLYSYSDFNKAFKQSNEGLNIAFSNFQKLPEDNLLKKEFQVFCNTPHNKKWLETSSLFHILSEQNKKNFRHWAPLDRDLILLKEKGNPEAIARYNSLLTEHAQQIEFEKFTQFIAYKQIKEFQKDTPVKHIGDALIAFSHVDVWANQEAFLMDKRLGCPGTNWGFYTLNPDKLFNEDGSKGIGAKLLEQKFNHILDTNSSVRIDHIMGIVNPFLFENSKSHNGRYATHWQDLKGAENFRRIIPEILVPLIKENGLKIEDVVAEDLCRWLPEDEGKFTASGLRGIVKANEFRAEKILKTHKAGYWAAYGTHDDPPAPIRIKSHSYNDAHNLDYLTGYLNPLKQNDGIQNRNYNNTYNLLELKFTEIIGKYKRVQISFMDFFGINTYYNKGNTNDSRNWRLRIPDNYKKKFYDSFENSQRYATEPSEAFLNSGFTPLNILKIYKDALIAKRDLAIAQNPNDSSIKEKFDKELEKTLKNLDKLTEILKEKTPSVDETTNIVKKNAKPLYFALTAIAIVGGLFGLNKIYTKHNFEQYQKTNNQV